MTQTLTLIATPDPDDNRMPACPKGVRFCNGTCKQYDDGYHASGFTFLKARRWQTGKARKTELTLSVCRQDGRKKVGKPEISLITGDLSSEEVRLTAARARMLAAALLNAADEIDPFPGRVA